MSEQSILPHYPPQLDYAIHLQNVQIAYGSSAVIFADLTMAVPRGNIYGLLGPSGCGKTSMIRTILGILTPNSGQVSVFGKKPGSSGSNVPGPVIGYMPQDISLYDDLSIAETLWYFGKLYRLGRDECLQRIEFLINFLKLPDRKRMVGVLSGGQMRRVSLALALIHKPPLLILDEPTVGVDPLLRQSIWTYLVEMSRTDHITVLITTHYIEEAKEANLVGFIRDGKLLDQGEPNGLLRRYKVETLEHVFLHLCAHAGEVRGVTESDMDRDSAMHRGQPLIVSAGHPITVREPDWTTPFRKIRVMAWKNICTFSRSPGYVLFQILLPMIQATLFCACLGRNIHQIPVAIYDGDNSSLSQNFISTLDSEILRKQELANESAVWQTLNDGEQSMGIIIRNGFLAEIIKRRLSPPTDLNATIYGDKNGNETIHLVPDMYDQVMVQAAYKEILRSFNIALKILLQSFGESPATIELPIEMDPPIYGEQDSPFTWYMAPGAILSIAFFSSISLTAIGLVKERNSGLIERTLVVGVSHFEIMISQIITNSLIILVQVLLLLTMTLAAFKIPFHGDLFWIFVLTISQSYCGMAFGLFVSSVSATENTATMLSLGVFYPMLLLSGTVWPLEAMAKGLKNFAYILPATIPTKSLHNMMTRGWGLLRWGVLDGFLVTYAWIAVFFAASFIITKYFPK